MLRLRQLLSLVGREALAAALLVLVVVLAQTAVLWRALARERDNVERAVHADLDNLARALEARWADELASAERPSFALPFALPDNGPLQVDGAALGIEPADCRTVGWQLPTATGAERGALIERLLERCPRARGPSGALLIPTLAAAGELAPASFERWRAQHQKGAEQLALTELERAQELLRVEQEPGAPPRRVATAHLLALVQREAGGVRGWLVTPQSLVRATPALSQDDLRAQLVAHAQSRWQTPVRLDTLTLALQLEDARVVDARTAKSRALVAGTSVASLSLFVAFAVVVLRRLSRLRKESELRVDFVAAVSHELRTPIASLRLLTDLLRGDLPAAEQKEALCALDQATTSLSERAERWLTVARLGRGEIEARRQQCDVASLLRARVRGLEGAAVEAPAALRAWVDPLLFELAVDNLVENARRYGASPFAFHLHEQHDTVTLTYSDHGPGFGANPARLLLPFERGDTRLHRATDGVGLGLALIASACRAHGGKVTLGARPGGGARCTLTFRGPT